MHLQVQPQQVIHKIRKEVRVFEIGQDAQVHHHAQRRYGRTSPLGFETMQPLGCKEVIDNDKEQERQEHATGLVVEEQRHGKQIAVAQRSSTLEWKSENTANTSAKNAQK